MRIAFFINTPAQVHLYRNVILSLQSRGHWTKILAREYGDTLELLDSYGFQYTVYSSGDRPKVQKIGGVPFDVLRAYASLRKPKPDILMGVGIYSTITSMLLDRPAVIFNDSEPIPLQLPILKSFADVVITPSCFRANLGGNHIRVDSFKELAYLHPNHFKPNRSVIEKLGIGPDEEYALLRFNGFAAVHDFRRKGFSIGDKRRLVSELKKHLRVFISSEGKLPRDLNEYALAIPRREIHDVIAHAKLLVADTQTMITEAAVLGTPGIRYNTFVGGDDMGNFLELQEKYGLIRNLTNPDEAISEAVRLAQERDLKSRQEDRRECMLREKIDLAEYLVHFIEDFPARNCTIAQ